MKFIKNGFKSKLIIILVILIMCSAIMPTHVVYADAISVGADVAGAVGGALLKPIVDFVLAIGDAVINIIHRVLFNVEDSIIKINLNNTAWEWFVSIAIGVIIAVAVAALIIWAAAVAGPAIIAAIGAKIGIAAGTASMSAAALGAIVVTAAQTGIGAGVCAAAFTSSNFFKDNIVLPLYVVSPAEIFSGEIPLLDANFFDSNKGLDKWSPSILEDAEKVEEGKGDSEWGTNTDGKEEQALQPIANTLKPTIASWYYTLRTIAIVAMIPILMYVGIRIMTSSIASEKAKYKNMLTDWVIAFCLIFVMHYIMIFANEVTDAIVEVLNSVSEGQEFRTMIEDKHEGKIRKRLEENQEILNGKTVDDVMYKDDQTGQDYLLWSTNLMGMIRIQASLEAAGNFTYIGYVIAFLILVWYTIFFLYTYIRRIIYLAFLTIIAPMVAMTYPIDKINDGRAQAFDTWLKEYIFNLLIQPMHLILYTVLVTSAFDLSSSNIIYTLIAIGFLIPAEKLVRRFFGFEKAQTPGALGGVAGAGLLMAGMNKIFRKHNHNNNSDGGGSSKEEKDDDINYNRTTDIDRDSMYEMPEGKDDKPEDKSEDKPIDDKGPTEKDPADEFRRKDEEAQQEEQKEQIKTQEKAQNDDEENTKRKAEEIANNMKKRQEQEDREQREQQEKRVNAIRKKRLSLKGMREGSKAYLRSELRRKIKNYRPEKSIKKFTRRAGGMMIGAGAGILGASIGIATGDLGKTGQYAATSAVGGYALGSTLLRDPNNKDVKAAGQEYEMAKYDNMDDYRLARLLQRREEFIDDNISNYQELRGKATEKEAREELEQYGDFIDSGIEDIEAIAAAVNLIEKEGWSRTRAKTTAKYYKEVGKKPSKLAAKEYDDLVKRYKRELSKKHPEYTDGQVDNITNQILDRFEDFGKAKDDLTEVK